MTIGMLLTALMERISRSADLLFSKRATEIRSASGFVFLTYLIMESEAAEGDDVFRTLYPLPKIIDSITQHPMICCSPSGAQIKIICSFLVLCIGSSIIA
jgi:hypothetical protein